jgi:hypothetical protein
MVCLSLRTLRTLRTLRLCARLYFKALASLREMLLKDQRRGPLLQFIMRTVAERHALAVLAAAQPDLFLPGNLELHRREIAALVGTVAEWLVPRFAAGAPPVGAGLEFLGKRRFLCNGRF